jgi:hypothetical protein
LRVGPCALDSDDPAWECRAEEIELLVVPFTGQTVTALGPGRQTGLGAHTPDLGTGHRTKTVQPKNGS